MPQKKEDSPLTHSLHEGAKGASDAFGWGAGKHDPQLAALVALLQQGEDNFNLLGQWLKLFHDSNHRQEVLLQTLLQRVEHLEARLEQQGSKDELTHALAEALKPRLFSIDS